MESALKKEELRVGEWELVRIKVAVAGVLVWIGNQEERLVETCRITGCPGKTGESWQVNIPLAGEVTVNAGGVAGMDFSRFKTGGIV